MGIICGGGEMITTVKLELGFSSFFIKRFQQKSNELNKMFHRRLQMKTFKM